MERYCLPGCRVQPNEAAENEKAPHEAGLVNKLGGDLLSHI